MEYYYGNFYLNQEEMETNAIFIYNYLSTRGWTVNAISGLLGNTQTESTHNPALWESRDEGNLDGGYGLVQWTPATKFLDWCTETQQNPLHMESNLNRLFYEINNNVQWIPTTEFPYSMKDFTLSTDSPYNLGIAFLKNYERPFVPDQPQRGTQAEFWFEFLGGVKKKGMPVWMMVKPY